MLLLLLLLLGTNTHGGVGAGGGAGGHGDGSRNATVLHAVGHRWQVFRRVQRLRLSQIGPVRSISEGWGALAG